METAIQAATQSALEISTAQLKSNLHRIVDELDNAEILRAIEVILKTAMPVAQLEDRTVNSEELSSDGRAAVEEGWRQSEAGLGRPHAEVWAEYEVKYGVKCDL